MNTLQNLTKQETYLKLIQSLEVHKGELEQYQKVCNFANAFSSSFDNPYHIDLKNGREQLDQCYCDLSNGVEEYLKNHQLSSCKTILKKFGWEIKEHMSFDPRPNRMRTAGLWFNNCERVVTSMRDKA